jgi:hypothetical protein
MVIQSSSRLYSAQEYLALEESVEQFSKTSEGKWLFSESEAEKEFLTLVSTNYQIPHR